MRAIQRVFRFLFFAAGLHAAALVSPAAAMDSTWVRLWRADLEAARTEFPKAHADLFHTLSRASFDSSLTALAKQLPVLTQAEATMELARLVARVGDGHTRLTLPVREGAGFFEGHSGTEPAHVPGLEFADLPVRLGFAQDTLFVAAVAASRSQLLGAEVLRIGDRATADAILALRPYLHRDNEQQIRDLLPDYLVLPDVLAAAGITAVGAPVAIQCRRVDGRIEEVLLEAARDGDSVSWTKLPAPSGHAPRASGLAAEPFWFERISGTSTVYVQFNEVANGEQETLAAFYVRLGEYVETNRIDRLILDLRANRGGNNVLNRSLLHELLRHEGVNRSGGLFVLIGRSTFSAAMMLAVDLERHTQAIFVGEPTGASPNGYGDSRKVRLPNTGLTARLSTLYWQYSGPNDRRSWIEPHLSAPPSRSAWLAGRDPAIEAVLQGAAYATRGNGTPRGGVHDFAGAITLSDRTQPMTLRWREAPGTELARLDLPAFGATDLELTELHQSPDRIAFSLPIRNGTLRFEARPDGARWYGRVSLDGVESPFVLWPADGGEPSKARSE